MNLHIYVRESLFPRTRAEGGDDLRPLDIVGKIDTYTNFEGIVRHNSVGSWTLELPNGTPQARMIQPGRGIVVYAEGQDEPIFSGPIRRIRKRWGRDDAGAGTLVVSGDDDNYLLAERLAWTNPEADIHLASKFQQWQTSLEWPNIGEVLRQLFLANFQGHPSRMLERVFIPGPESTQNFLNDDTARITRLHFASIDEYVQQITAVYGIRIRFVWHPNPAKVASNGDPSASGPGILLKLEPLTDLTNEVIFGPEFGNLQAYDYEVAGPQATRLVIATQNRTWKETVREPTFDEVGNVNGFVEREVERSGPERWYGYFNNVFYNPPWWGDPEMTPEDKTHTLPWAQAGFSATEVEWGFTGERYSDQRDIPWQWVQEPGKEEGWAQDPPVWSAQRRAVMDVAEAFHLENGPKASIVLDPLDTPNLVFGVHYQLGDLIRVVVDGEVRDEIVREARITSTVGEGARIRPVVGTVTASETPYLYSAIRRLFQRVSGVEAREDLVVLQEVPPVDFEFRRVVDD